jgi:polyisoprenoid-binding protein YceI
MNLKLHLVVSVVLSVCATLPPSTQSPSGPQTYTIDNAHTSVIFAINHFGLSYTYGRFDQCGGSFAMENGEPTASGFNFTIDASSIDTNNADRDQHLRGPDFFDCETFPEITFVTTGFQKVGNEYQVTGDLKMLDQVRSVTLPMQLVGVGKGPFGKDRAGFFTKFTIKRSDFGMDKMIGSIGDNVSITFSFEGVRE